MCAHPALYDGGVRAGAGSGVVASVSEAMQRSEMEKGKRRKGDCSPINSACLPLPPLFPPRSYWACAYGGAACWRDGRLRCLPHHSPSRLQNVASLVSFADLPSLSLSLSSLSPSLHHLVKVRAIGAPTGRFRPRVAAGRIPGHQTRRDRKLGPQGPVYRGWGRRWIARVAQEGSGQGGRKEKKTGSRTTPRATFAPPSCRPVPHLVVRRSRAALALHWTISLTGVDSSRSLRRTAPRRRSNLRRPRSSKTSRRSGALRTDQASRQRRSAPSPSSTSCSSGSPTTTRPSSSPARGRSGR